jgi:hypothetical protein
LVASVGAAVQARRTTAGGRILLGAQSHEARVRSWLASCGVAHLFRDDGWRALGALDLAGPAGTPQLEELDAEEAERRYGQPAGWGPKQPAHASTAEMLRNIGQTLRYYRGWRPKQ